MNREKRISSRHEMKVPIIYSNDPEEKSFEATVCNTCAEGMYIESPHQIEPRSFIYIKTTEDENVCISGAHKAYMGNVRWCRKLPDPGSTRYGIGVKYMLKGHVFNGSHTSKNNYWCDLCGESALKEIHTTEEHLYLCMDCFRQIGQLSTGRIQKSLLRFSLGNVC
jgi:hypothetical protein